MALRRASLLFLSTALLWVAPAHAQGPMQRARQDPAADQGAADGEPGGPAAGEAWVPWRGTALKWSQAMTTTILGVGQDIQSEAGEVYAHGYWALLNYYLVDEDGGSLRVATSPGFDVEYTNSDVTTDEREPQFRDLNLSLISALPLWHDSKDEFGATLLPNATLLFPTSEVSYAVGTYLTTSPRVTIGLGGPLLRDASFPAFFQVAAAVRWDHRFGLATEPVNPNVRKFQRTTYTNEPIASENLSGVPFAHDTVSAGSFLYFEGTVFDRTLEVTLAGSWQRQFLYTFDRTGCVQTLAGTCEPIGRLEDPSTSRVVTSFSVDATYYPVPELGVNVGYVNTANQLAPDGLRRSPFYSPSASFTTQVILSLDALYEAATGPRRSVRFVLPG